MRFATLLPSLFAVASLAAAQALEVDDSPRAVSPNPYPQSAPHQKRDCLLGILCFDTSSKYSSDVNNCGYSGNKCSKYSFLYGAGVQCSNGVCGPTTCGKSGFLLDFNWLTGECQDVTADTQNCGKCGQTCNLTGASSQKCSSGTCLATACSTGYVLTGGACVVKVDTTSDVNNCGGNGKCPTSYTNSIGSVVCRDSICQPSSCAANYAFNYSTKKCQLVSSDSSNCGAIGTVCSFPRGLGKCSAGSCTYTSCNSGSYMVDSVCTALDLQNDEANCGNVGVACTYANGVGTCTKGSCSLTSCNDNYALKTVTTGFIFTTTTTSCSYVNTASDVNNCGKVGNKCASYSSSSGSICTAGQCSGNCNAGYDWDDSLKYCRLVTSDINNCGSVGNVCAAANGTPQCVLGSCSVKSCDNTNGFYLVGTSCKALDLTSDINNCGLPGFKCPASFLFGSGVSCVNKVCRANTCLGLFDWDINIGACRDVSADTSNCGGCGKTCSFPNGQGACTGGSCKLSKCNTGFQAVDEKCVSMDITSDVNNCGGVGNVCKFPNGLGKCSNKVCTYTSCTTLNYVLASDNSGCSLADITSDVNNCGGVGKVCPAYANADGAAFCRNKVCQTNCKSGYAFDFSYNYCRATASDINNCGAIGTSCLDKLVGASAATCVGGSCYASQCKSGYTQISGVCQAIDLTSDVNNCGTLGFQCQFSPSGATGICKDKKCTITNCGSTAYVLSNGVCLKSTASQKARAKKSKIVQPKSLCPSHETACPVIGSSSFAMALDHHFSALGQFSTGVMDGAAGGYECLDTSQSLESCGGCASTGEGQDCSKIRGAVGYACEASECRVFSCQAGWRPNLTGTKCVRTHVDHSHSEGSNGSRTHRRHLASRHGHHGSIH